MCLSIKKVGKTFRMRERFRLWTAATAMQARVPIFDLTATSLPSLDDNQWTAGRCP